MGSEASPLFDRHPELLDGFRRGDRSALERVYWAYVEDVERLIGRCVWRYGSGRVAAAVVVEDLVQEVFTRAFSEGARVAYDGLRDYAPYLFTIARNVVADAFRINHREVPTDFEAMNELSALEDFRMAADLPRWADAQTLACVSACLAHLSPELGAVHHQRYELGVSQDAAAQALGISRQRLRTLEKRLRAGVSRELRRDRAKKISTSFASSPVLKRS